MKKVLVVLSAVVVLVVGALLAAPFLIPTETYSRQISAQVERATGRALAIDGEFRLSLLPRVALRADGVRLANREGAVEPIMASIGALELDVSPLALLRGVIEVDRLILTGPVIHLEIDAHGRPNWVLDDGEAGAPEVASAPSGPSGARAPFADLALGDIRIEAGTITFRDERSGTLEVVEDVALVLDLPDLASPLSLEGSLRYRGEPVALALALERPQALLEGGGSAARLALALPGGDARLDGRIEALVPLALFGDAQLDLPELPALLAWLAEPPALGPGVLERLAVAGALEVQGERLHFREARLALDDIEGAGEVEVDLAGSRPALRGDLALGEVDLTPYAPPGDGAVAGPGAGTAPATAGWSDETIDLPLPLGLDLALRLAVEGLRHDQLVLGRSELLLRADRERLRLDIERASLYGGQGQGWLEARLEGDLPVVEQRLRLENVALLPLLHALFEVDELEGTAELDLALASRGASERALIGNLEGEGRLVVREGAIVGVDLAGMVRNLASAFLGGGEQTPRTAFSELSGSFTIERGRVRNDDLRLRAPLLQLTGRGSIDLPTRTIPGYRFEPRALAAQGGEGGIVVPVEVAGPWDDLTFQADLRGTLESVIEAPTGAVREGVRRGGEGVRRLLEGLGGALGR